MKLATYRFRLKDSSGRNRLRKLGFAVNDIWNYSNETTAYQWSFRRQLLSAFDLHKLTAGVGKELGLHSQTVQAVVDEYAKCGKQFKRSKLHWRSRKRSLGWVPFKAVGVKVEADTVTYGGHTFRFWNTRPLPGKVRCGSFCEDAQGRWYVHFVCEDPTPERVPTGKEAGIDLGLKTLATLSDGVELSRENLTRKFEVKLASAQRARKKKQVTRIHAKIKNKRKDWNHKATTRLTNEYDVLVVGNVSPSKLKKTKMAKSVSDAGWADFKTMLAYKAIRLGVVYKEVNESFSTVTCAACSERSGPRGLRALGVRTWRCSSCGTCHDRDRNAAVNILRSARDIVRRREFPCLYAGEDVKACK
ncbi:transposase [Hymenobacter antarcticus]|uniref:RNA-guided endonuclease TnpB family protein n=1 Tax=Hymenobacter antarcticus TaxID=486270 RepID=A0ABP7R0N8_9BACT